MVFHFAKNSVTLPEDGFLNINSIEDDSPDDLTVDEGPVPVEHSVDDTDSLQHGFMIETTVFNKMSEDIVQHLDACRTEGEADVPLANVPVSWPSVDPQPINEFSTRGIASLAFVQLFPLGQADPTSGSRLIPVTELAASNDLLNFTERDPTSPTGELYYPFAENTRFPFWMVDRIRRHRALQRCSIYLRKNPSDATLKTDELTILTIPVRPNHMRPFEMESSRIFGQ